MVGNKYYITIYIGQSKHHSSVMEAVNVRKAHVMAVPSPAQGHVKPLLQLCRCIAKHGIKVTFVNIQFIHDKIFASAGDTEEHNIVFATIPGAEDSKMDLGKLKDLANTMPRSLEELIGRINGSNPEERISCVVADIAVGFVVEAAQKMGAEPLLFSPASAAFFALSMHVPKLLEDGIVDPNGIVKKGERIILSDDIPGWGENEVLWSIPGNPEAQKAFFELIKQSRAEIYQNKLILINTCYELESSACDLDKIILPIGPLHQMSIHQSCPSSSCSFYPEDASCLKWLDSKSHGSVVYISFGSLAVFPQQQLDELALGLELSGRTFLWVMRSDIMNGSPGRYPDGFLDRVVDLGMVAAWVPQERVLSHPSVGCFMSHCGWNSTLEGVGKGVPFLCWPCFGDQFHNQNYICDKWETGLRISADESGIRSRHEIKKKVDRLFSNEKLRANALRLRGVCARTALEGGSSNKNFERFIDHLRR